MSLPFSKSWQTPEQKRSLPSRLFAALVGDYQEHSLERRLFNLMTFFNGMANMGGAPLMLELPRGDVLFYLHLVTGFGFFLLYGLARFYCNYERLYWPFVFLMAAFVGFNAVGNAASMGGAHYYLIMGVVIAVILSRSWRRTLGALLVFGLTACVVFYIERFQPEWLIPHASEDARWADVFGNYLFVLSIVGVMVMVLGDTLERERRRSEALLLNILPKSIVEELKHAGRSEPRHYPSATILFTDIVGFTRMAEKTSPDALVRDLDAVFSVFDRIVSEHHVVRIKTIGDAYMAAGGVPEPNETHPLDVVQCALDMQKAMQVINQERQKQGKEAWRMRIGVHTGAVSAGVVGMDRFAYDLWGDAVNVASRMESHGEADRVNISEATYMHVASAFKTESRGCVPVKNRGELKMFFVSERP